MSCVFYIKALGWVVYLVCPPKPADNDLWKVLPCSNKLCPYMHTFWVEVNLCRFFFIVCWYMHCHWRSSYQKDWDPINRFNSATFLCLFHAKTWISNDICRSLPLFLCSVSSGKRWLVRFVENGGIADHYCLNFVFIVYYLPEPRWTYLPYKIHMVLLTYLNHNGHIFHIWFLCVDKFMDIILSFTFLRRGCS